MTETVDGASVLAANLTERDLQRHVRKFAEDMGWRVAVTWSSIHSPKGWPDLTCCRAGKLVFIELKTEKGKITPEQREWLNDLNDVPGVIFSNVVRPSDWYAGMLDEVLR